MNTKSLFLLFFLWSQISFAQTTTISGNIKDQSNSEVLIGANIFIANLDIGTSTNEYGFFSLTIPNTDSLSIIFSYLGYEPQVKKIFLKNDLQLNIDLIPQGEQLSEVVVSSKQMNDDNVNRTQMGVIDVPVSLVRQIPAVLGEVDVLKVIQLLPGVQSGQEGTTGFYVRGGNADQNLVQLDEATIYNPNHLFGLVSTFNSRALNNVKLTKGGFPANFGGRLSSILEISMKEGNKQRTEIQGGLGLISSNLTIEGPIKKDKSSFMISGRRSYLDLFIKAFAPKGNETNYSLYDINAKVNFKLSEKDHLYFSFFTGKDNAKYASSGFNYGLRFGNGTGTLRWNHIFGQKLFLNTSLIYNNYLLSLWSVQSNTYEQFYSRIEDLNAKIDFQYYPNPKHFIKFGGAITHHTFSSDGKENNIPKDLQVVVNNSNNLPTRKNQEVAFYVNDEIHITPKFAINAGVRVPLFFTPDTTYLRVEPRLSAKVNLTKTSSVKASYTLMNQFVHLVPSSTASIPTDIWTPSSRITKPQFAEQYALGYFQNFKKDLYEASIELYYKKMDNQVLFKAGTDLGLIEDMDAALVFGKGWSYGAEFFLRKNYGRYSGWISYTLSWTNQKFPDLNFGNTFPFRFDKRHVLSATGVYNLNKKWSLSAVFVLSSGSAFTLPTSRVNTANSGSIFEGSYYLFEGRNNARLAPYHRLDISATRKKKTTKFGKPFESEWVFGAYNLYSRRNPYFVYFQIDINKNTPVAKQVSLLPIIPSVSYNFKF